jgi:S-methylmethionine-dependent homocysteine/selenocysteine methylase
MLLHCSSRESAVVCHRQAVASIRQSKSQHAQLQMESVTVRTAVAEFASAGAAWHMAGATVLGSCSRVGPQDIAALSEAFPLSEPRLAVVT